MAQSWRVLVLAATVAACGSTAGGSTGGNQKGTLELANFDPFSGPNSAYGYYEQAGCVPAVNLINAEGGVLGHKRHAREMQLLTVYSGMSNVDAIRSMTSAAAVTVNGEGIVGEIAEGMRADLLVVNGNPLADLSVLVDKSNIETVVKSGKIVQFDDDAELERRHSHPELVLTYSQTAITYDIIFGDGPPVGEAPVLWEPGDAVDVERELQHKELDARAVVDA